MMSNQIKFLLSLFLTCTILIISPQTFAFQKHLKYKSKGLIIKQVITDIVDGELYIHGMNFDNGRSPSVTLGDIELMVKSYTSINITATLPPALLDGDYRVFITTGKGHRRSDAYDLTIGGTMQLALAGQKCLQGEFLTGFNDAGELICQRVEQNDMSTVISNILSTAQGRTAVLQALVADSAQLQDFVNQLIDEQSGRMATMSSLEGTGAGDVDAALRRQLFSSLDWLGLGDATPNDWSVNYPLFSNIIRPALCP